MKAELLSTLLRRWRLLKQLVWHTCLDNLLLETIELCWLCSSLSMRCAALWLLNFFYHLLRRILLKLCLLTRRRKLANCTSARCSHWSVLVWDVSWAKVGSINSKLISWTVLWGAFALGAARLHNLISRACGLSSLSLSVWHCSWRNDYMTLSWLGLSYWIWNALSRTSLRSPYTLQLLNLIVGFSRWDNVEALGATFRLTKSLLLCRAHSRTTLVRQLMLILFILLLRWKLSWDSSSVSAKLHATTLTKRTLMLGWHRGGCTSVHTTVVPRILFFVLEWCVDWISHTACSKSSMSTRLGQHTIG